MLGIGLLLSVFALHTIGDLGESLKIAISRSARKLEINGEIRKEIESMRSFQRGEVLFGMLKDQGQMNKNRESFASSSDALGKNLNELKTILDTQAGKTAVETMHRQLTTWQGHYRDLLNLTDQKKFEEAGKILVQVTMADAMAMQESSDSLLTTVHGLMNKAEADSDASVTQSKWITILLIGLSVAIGVVVLIVVRQINSKLKEISQAMGSGAEEVASAAGQVASASQSLAQGASEQAASLEETSASGEEVTSMTRQNADNSRTAAECMAEVDTRVGETNRTLQEMETSMAEINASSDKIARIIKVIDEIAFQTNILALNAAVEAARAGEAGMGFAVVADEVRNLAQRSAQAAKDTAGLIEDSISKSQEGSDKLTRVSTAIQAITASATKVKTLIDEVNLGSQEQARGIEQISKAIAQMEHVTQRNAASAEQSASAAQEMNAQADTIKTFVAEMRMLVGGVSEAPSLHAPKRQAIKRAASVAKATKPESASRPHPVMPKARQTPVREPAHAHAGPPVSPVANDFPLDEEFTEF